MVDFDGVIADSEVPAKAVLAEFVTELGVPTTAADSYRDGAKTIRVHSTIAPTGLLRPSICLAGGLLTYYHKRRVAQFCAL